MPRLFHDPRWDQDACSNVDIFGETFTSASYRPPFAPGAFNAQCDLTVLEHEIVRFNKESLDSEDEDSLHTQRRLYEKLNALRNALPSHLRNEWNPVPGTNLLRQAVVYVALKHYTDGITRLYYDEVATFILRPVQVQTIFIDDISSRELRIMHCQHIIEIAEYHFRTQLSSDYTIMFLHGCFHALLTLIPFLDETLCQDFFTRAAAAFKRGIRDIPGMRLVMSAVEAVVWAMGKKVPPTARASFLGKAPRDVEDVSPEWGFPQMEYVQSQPGIEPENWEELKEVRGSLGALLQKWNALTL
jgi:hypothetical protein